MSYTVYSFSFHVLLVTWGYHEIYWTEIYDYWIYNIVSIVSFFYHLPLYIGLRHYP